MDNYWERISLGRRVRASGPAILLSIFGLRVVDLTPNSPLGKVTLDTGSAEGTSEMNVLIKSAWGSDDPTKASFTFLHANAFAQAGHQVRIFLLGEAVNLMKDELAEAVTPVGWPPLAKIMAETIEHRIPISV